MRGFLILLFAGVFLPTSGVADIRDLRDLSDGNDAALFIGFDSVPELLSTHIGDRLIELEFAGGDQLRPRRIEAVTGQTISALEIVPTDTARKLRIELPANADGFEIAPTETGYLLRWRVVGSASTGAMAASETPPQTDRVTDTNNIHTDLSAAAELATGSDAGAADSASRPVALGLVDGCGAAQTAVEIDPWDIDALAVHSECLLENGDATQAIVLLERVIAFEPGRFDAVLTLAEAHEAQGDLDAARGLYEQAATVAATDGQAVAARARARALAN
ncbi:MAG: hypothetical protein DHS20C06_20460 [Hyphobacterium sp.]|nr:MAG: hypothetical protein DHS20C06_20460 [Hyphobacterium sp.]